MQLADSRKFSLRALLFLALLLPVWGFGIVRGQRITRAVAAMPPFFGEELARFERVRPRLESAAGAWLLSDRAPGLSFSERFFAAQYSLAPTVLAPAYTVEAVIAPGWQGHPLFVLCAFDDPGRLSAALAALEGAAHRRKLSYAAEPLDAVLTLVRLGAS